MHFVRLATYCTRYVRMREVRKAGQRVGRGGTKRGALRVAKSSRRCVRHGVAAWRHTAGLCGGTLDWLRLSRLNALLFLGNAGAQAAADVGREGGGACSSSAAGQWLGAAGQPCRVQPRRAAVAARAAGGAGGAGCEFPWAGGGAARRRCGGGGVSVCCHQRHHGLGLLPLGDDAVDHAEVGHPQIASAQGRRHPLRARCLALWRQGRPGRP